MDKQQGLFSEEYCLTAEYCDEKGNLSALAPFVMFQALAMEHNEAIGNGVAGLRSRNEFWLVAHTRVDYYGSAKLMEYVRAETWPERSDPRSIRCYRDYRVLSGEKILAEGRTQWVVCGLDGTVLPFSASGFGQGFPYPDLTVRVPEPARMRDAGETAALCGTYQVRRSDLDFMGHMNHTAYVRMLLDAVNVPGRPRYIELHYSVPCMECEVLQIYAQDAEDRIRLSVKNGAGKTAVRAEIGY